QLDLAPVLVATDEPILIELPHEQRLRRLSQPEPVVERRRAAAGGGEAVRPDAHLLDAHLERLPGARSPHGDWPDQWMPGVALRVALVDRIGGRRSEAPRDIWRRQQNRVTALDLEHGRVLARERPAQRPSLERHLVRRHVSRSASPGYRVTKPSPSNSTSARKEPARKRTMPPAHGSYR